MFGFHIPKEVSDTRGIPRSYWGARAIYKPRLKNPIGFLPDRQQFEPLIERPLLLPWLNNEALPWLREELKKKAVDIDSHEILTYKSGENFTLMASPQSSYGYLYIGAWRYDPPNCSYELKEPTPTKKWTANFPIPKIGDKVMVKINSIGPGQVLDYFYEHDYQGVRVLLDEKQRADWHKKQCPGDPTAMVFGREIALL